MSVARHPRGALAGELARLDRALVESLAGTGKTQTAAELCLTLVLEHEVEPDRIRLLTFNEKAAREGRERVRQVTERLLGPPERPPALDEPAFVVDAVARVRLEDALRRPPVVQTIHAFAQEVLGALAFDARLPLRLELVGRADAFRQAFGDFARRDLARDDAAELQVWLDQRGLERLERLLRRCTAEEPSTELRPTFDPDAPAAALTRVAALPPGFWTRLRRWTREQDWGRRWRVREKLLELTETVPGRARDLAATGARLAAHDPQLAGDLRYVLDEAVVPAPEHADAWAALSALARAQVGFDAAAANLWTARMAAAYREHKRARGVLDFDDLLRLLDEALAAPGGEALRERARALVDVVIVDECQDQNVTIYGGLTPGGQERGIFRPLFFRPGYAGKAYQSGDPHQALYGWRGADIHGGFLRAKADLEATPGARVLGLLASFRSTPRLLEALNAIFDQAARPPFFRGEVRYDAPAVPGRPTLRAVGPDGEDVAPLVALEARPRGDALDPGELRRAVAAGIADHLERLRSGEGAITLVEDGRASKRLTLDDCFVIVRSHREAALVKEVLAARGIPALLHRATKLHATPEAEDVAHVLAALAAPEREDLRLRAFATPLLGVAWDRLPGVRDLPPSHPLVLRWARWGAQAERDLPRLLAGLLDEAGVAARGRLGGLPGGRSVAVYQQVLDALVERATRVPGDASRLLVHVERLRAEAEGEDAPAVRQEAREPSARIMTVFAAKGLSTGVVLLLGGFTPFVDRDGAKVYQDPGDPAERAARFVASQGDEAASPRREHPAAPVQAHVYHDPHGTRVLHVGPLDAAAAALFEASRRQEDTFLLYTALTRAAARVVVPFVPRAADGGWLLPDLAGSYHEPLNERLAALVEARAADPRLATLLRVEPALDPPRADDAAPAAWSRLATWAPAPIVAARDDEALARRRELIRAHRPQQVVSYTSLKKGLLEASPLAPVADADAGDADHPPGVGDDLPAGRHAGNLVHALLERCDLDALRGAPDPATWGEGDEVRALLAREAERAGLGPEALPAARDVVFHTLTREVDVGGRRVRLADCAPLRREVGFRVELPGAGDADLGPGAPALRRGFLHGSIDALTRLPGAPAIVLGIDWKSDRLADYAPATVHAKTQQDYALQVMAYSYVLARLARVRDPAALERVDVRLVYVYLRGAGVALARPTTGVAVYRLTPARFMEYERFLRGVE
ncbi:MAG: UvrD-helicase domain-containing protein [Planctomycetes bacterium]|nr:UvrD-helicase domain-containing protein [Planctomycetota bacterium]